MGIKLFGVDSGTNQSAAVTIDGNSQSTTAAAVTLSNNINIDGEFTPQ